MPSGGPWARVWKPLVEHLLFNKGQVCVWLFECLWLSPGHWMKAHSKPRSFGQSPVSRTMSWICLDGLFMGPRYEPSMHCPRPVLLGSPHQPQSGCSKHRPHVRKPEQFWAGMTENRVRWEAKENKASRFWEINSKDMLKIILSLSSHGAYHSTDWVICSQIPPESSLCQKSTASFGLIHHPGSQITLLGSQTTQQQALHTKCAQGQHDGSNNNEKAQR